MGVPLAPAAWPPEMAGGEAGEGQGGSQGPGLEALAEVLPGGGDGDGDGGGVIASGTLLGRGSWAAACPPRPSTRERQKRGAGGLRPPPTAGSRRAGPLSRRSLGSSPGALWRGDGGWEGGPPAPQSWGAQAFSWCHCATACRGRAIMSFQCFTSPGPLFQDR